MLARKKTWTLMQRHKVPHDQKVLRGRLILKRKRDNNGKILKYKVRWVVKGFEQQYDCDYDDTFAGVCKTATWKIAIAFAAHFGWYLKQMDVVRALLESFTKGEVFVEVPPVCTEGGKETIKEFVCMLLKALYGLKQSPRI